MLSKELNINDKSLASAEPGSSKADRLKNEPLKERQSNTARKSKLSAGPSNPNHKTYLHNEELIYKELDRTIAERSIAAKVSQICKNAKLSVPTFYLHHRNMDDALMSYEGKLYSEFLELVIANIKEPQQYADRLRTFELLLIFIRKNCDYFRASLVSNNLHLLYKILRELSSHLIAENTHSKAQLFYVTSLLTVIIWWGNAEDFSKQTLAGRAREMALAKIWRSVEA